MTVTGVMGVGRTPRICGHARNRHSFIASRQDRRMSSWFRGRAWIDPWRGRMQARSRM